MLHDGDGYFKKNYSRIRGRLAEFVLTNLLLFSLEKEDFLQGLEFTTIQVCRIAGVLYIPT